MADFHRNVFYYYHGAHHSEHEREQQLENNTTKALANTLEHCSDSVVIWFLSWLVLGLVVYALFSYRNSEFYKANARNGAPDRPISR